MGEIRLCMTNCTKVKSSINIIFLTNHTQRARVVLQTVIIERTLSLPEGKEVPQLLHF